MEGSESLRLPPRPSTPSDSDCCGSGCMTCVFDIHDKEVSLWKDECDRIRRGATASSEYTMKPERYVQLRILSIVKETQDSFVFTFAVSGGVAIKVGQHLVLRHRSDDRVITRSYTPIRTDADSFDVLIKIYNNGAMSRWVSTWQEGDLAEWRGPIGQFDHTPNKFQHLVLVAAGTGIAPMISIIQHVLNNDVDETRVHLVFSCRSSSDVLCRSLIRDFTDYWNFSVTYFLTQDTQENSSMRQRDKVVYSRLSRELLRRELPENLNQTRVVVCGTRSFDKDMMNYLALSGFPPDCVHKF